MSRRWRAGCARSARRAAGALGRRVEHERVHRDGGLYGAVAEAGHGEALLMSVGLKKDFPVKRRRTSDSRADSGRSTESISRSAAARLSAWSASRAAASRPRATSSPARADGGRDFEASTSAGAPADAEKQMRRHLQIVFQDSLGSLDPRVKWRPARRGAGDGSWRTRVAARSSTSLDRVGMPPDGPTATPTSSAAASGSASASPGRSCTSRPRRRRRAGLGPRRLHPGAGAEPACELQEELALAYLFVSHDLAVVGTSPTGSP